MKSSDFQVSKAKSGNTSKKRKGPRQLDENRFVSMEAQERYYDLYEEKKFVQERCIVKSTFPETSVIKQTIIRRGWEQLTSYAMPACGEIVKEFCANAELEDLQLHRVSYVRGREVPFDTATIESFLLTQHPEGASCEYTNLYNRMQPSAHGLYRDELPHLAEMIRLGITCPYTRWLPKAYGIPDKLILKDLNAECRFWHTFINSNVLPSTNLTDVNVERAALLYTLTGTERVNIASVISDRICYMIRGSRKRELLGFASLINNLSSNAGVDIPFDVLQDDDGVLDIQTAPVMTWDTYVEARAKSDVEFHKRAAEAGDRPPSPRNPRMPIPPPAPQPETPTGFAAPTTPHGYPSGFDFYGLQQQLSRLSVQNEVLIMQGEYTHRFLEHAHPSVPFTTFQPVYPEVPPPYVFQQYHPAPPPGDVPMPPHSLSNPEPSRPAAESSSYAARRFVMEDAEDEDE